MPARTSVAQRFQIFDHTVAEMESRLLTVRAPAQMMTVLGWGMAELNRVYAGTSAGVRSKVACRDGCASCCHLPVDVQAHEVFFAADHIQINFPPEQLDHEKVGHRWKTRMPGSAARRAANDSRSAAVSTARSR